MSLYYIVIVLKVTVSLLNTHKYIFLYNNETADSIAIPYFIIYVYIDCTDVHILQLKTLI